MAPKTRTSARLSSSTKPAAKARSKGVRPVTKSIRKVTKRKVPTARLGKANTPRTVSKPAENAVNFRVPVGSEHPPWTTLPYEILLSIYQFAAYPLIDENWNRRETIGWLRNTSVVCRSFLEPALAALYHGPPIVYLHHFEALTRLMSTDKPLSIDYRAKVHQLDFEVNLSKFASFSGRLHELIARLPALKAVGVHQAADIPQPMNVSMPQTTRADLIYRAEWIDSLASSNVTGFKFHSLSLRNQKNSRFEHWALHQGTITPSFKFLERLEIAGLIDTARCERNLSGALQALPNLRRLSFLRCNFNEAGKLAEDDMIIFNIPSTLSALEFVSCHELTSERLAAVLRLSGNRLRSLSLRHNKDLSLTFLTDLAGACPSLQTLDYDLSLYSTSLVLHHAEPTFRELLTTAEIPIWPASLQVLEFNQLRKWEPEAAENFFNSLYDSAASLLDLRMLSVTASIGSGWRERVIFREKIISPLIDMFSRIPDDAETSPASRKVPHRHGAKSRTQEIPVHGKCDTVYIRVDNLRPAEEQMTESNFLDSEQSGDDNYVE